MDDDADATELSDHQGLFSLASSEEPEHPPRERFYDSPSELEPQPPVTDVTDGADAHVRPWVLDFQRLVALVN
ncbi:MAG: hypothetical protein ACQGQO_01165 [Sphaerochaetaceae bacterium]